MIHIQIDIYQLKQQSSDYHIFFVHPEINICIGMQSNWMYA